MAQISEVIKLCGSECLPSLVFLGLQNSKANRWENCWKLCVVLVQSVTFCEQNQFSSDLVNNSMCNFQRSEILIYLNCSSVLFQFHKCSWQLKQEWNIWAWSRYHFNLSDQELAVYLCLIPTDNAVFLNQKVVDWILTKYF